MRLNPFVYISETNIRFYLLVMIGIIVPSIWALLFVLFLSAFWELEITIFLRLSILIPIFFLNTLLIYWNYRRFPKKIVKKLKLKEFSQNKFPDHFEYVNKLYSQHLSTGKQPTLMYQPMDLSESAFTFGTKKRPFVGISGGLIRKFRKNIDGFRSIFLHEMGHLVNKDVEKAYLAVATLRSLSLILPITLGIFLVQAIYSILNLLYLGSLAGYDIGYIISRMNLENWALMGGGFALYFLIFWVIVYVLRNQIIRLREFYADAKVLEWEESPDEILRTLEASGGKQHSKFEMLTKFHPNIKERIQVLKNNLKLFAPNLWVAFVIGYFYGLVEMRLSILKTIISSWDMSLGIVPELNIEFRAFISIFIFTILMLAISSNFHKSILKDIFIKKTRYFSAATILDTVKFSLAFSLGYLTDNILSIFETGSVAIDSIIGDLPIYPQVWILHAVYFSTSLIFLIIFASILIRKSFSKKEAKTNFLMISIFASILYVINRFVAIEILHNKLLLIVFFLVFSAVAYVIIKIRDRKLCCPNCNNKISNLREPKLNCPHCHHDLYSWAFYSFSNRSQ